jgi:tRNA 2-thiouridine synthesizing protein A
MEPTIDHVLDTKGLNCPLPVLKTKKAIGQVPSGGILQVLSTDPGSVADFEAFCRQTGNELGRWPTSRPSAARPATSCWNRRPRAMSSRS